MKRFKHLTTIIFSIFLFASFTTPASASSEKVTRRDIDVIFEYGKVDDGFGNVRKILVSGTIQNNALRIASKVSISFKLIWKNRTSDARKLEFQNVEVNAPQSFDFAIELGTHPDTLKSLVCNIDQIKFTNTREASPLTPFNLVLHEMYTLTRLNEEGKSFFGILNYIKEANPFQLPVKDEFETTSEYENRVNQAENNHFSKLMDELEKRYGQLLGGKNAIIRFLPRTFNKNIIYLSECSAYFQVPIQFGKFNADMSRFENVAMNPRTFAFPLQTYVTVRRSAVYPQSRYLFSPENPIQYNT